MEKPGFKKKLTLALGFTGLTWLLMSVLIFLFIKMTFSFDTLFYYFLISVLIGAYALYLLNKGRFFSRLFFVGAYIIAFVGLYYGSNNSGNGFGSFGALILMIIPLITISALGFTIDLNIASRKKNKKED